MKFKYYNTNSDTKRANERANKRGYQEQRTCF